MTSEALPSKPSILGRKLLPGVTVATLAVIAIMVLSAVLHFINIDRIGDANAYYTAAVKSMLGSWSNFFFVAAEPGGSVTVDKPPLGLWIEAVFAYFLGVSGFSVSLPNILAGIFGVPLLYVMIKKYMGELAGLVAALVMVLTPVFVATNRNNTMDGMLVFSLLLAAWTFIHATETGKLRWVLVGAFIIGLGFNIKMLQAYLPLPAFYALYFFGSKEGWWRKVINLGIASALLVAVSLSWAVIVDLTPANQRPYIGSSHNNTVMGLIIGHNGMSRLFGGFFGRKIFNSNLVDSPAPTQDGQGNIPAQGLSPAGAPNGQTRLQAGDAGSIPQRALDGCIGESLGASCSFNLPNGANVTGTCITPPNSSHLACAPQGMIPQNGQVSPGGTPFSNETGTPGVFRFFTRPLSKQMSWLLPFALIGLALVAFTGRIRLPLESGAHKALVLWGGWLVTCLVFFSAISGIFHSYYAIMLVPPLSAVVGMGFAQLWDWGRTRNWVGVLFIIAALITLTFQVFAFTQYGTSMIWIALAGATLALGSVLAFSSTMRRAAYVVILAALLIAPVYWTMMTVASNSNVNLPTAYQGTQQSGPGPNNRARNPGQPGANVNSELVAYLEANTQGVKYLVAVPSSQQGATMVLATGRPVLYMGGFTGQDEVVTADDLSQMAANGELRYVLYGNASAKQEIANWLQTSCTVVPEFSRQNNQTSLQPGPGNQAITLYQCSK